MQSFLQNIRGPQADNPTMSGYISSIRNKVGTLLQGEVDGETEDDTIVCRALRKYYADPARNAPAPPWLPPDPRAPPSVVVQPMYSQPSVGSNYGVSNQGGRLKDLFGNGAAQPDQSLRGTPPNPSLRSLSANDMRRPGYTTGRMGPPEPEIQPRPLPSQSSQSYQRTMYGIDGPTPPGSAGGGKSASDLLKDRLRNKGKLRVTDTSPVGRSNSYGDGVKATGEGNYEDRFMPSGNSVGYGGSSSKGGDQPFMAATSPWASNEAEFGGGGYGDSPNSRGPARRGPGLPSGPRGMR